MYHAENISRANNEDKSDRFPENFNPVDIHKKLVNFYFNKFRKEMFQRYLSNPSQGTINRVMAEIKELVINKHDDILAENIDIQSCKDAYEEFKKIMEQV